MSRSYLIINEPKEICSDNIIVNNESDCEAHIVQNTNDNSGNITLSNRFRSSNINV